MHVEGFRTLKKSEYNLIKSKYCWMKARAEDVDMALNRLEEYDWIKMELITFQTKVMVYKQKI
jgi:hypothetical protein